MAPISIALAVMAAISPFAELPGTLPAPLMAKVEGPISMVAILPPAMSDSRVGP